MNSHLKHKSFFMINLSLFLLITAPDAENIQSSVDANEAIEQVNHNFTEPREGEFLFDTILVCDPVPEAQMSPSVAFDGTNYLVVWEDCRAGIAAYDIYATRVNQNGDILDPSGIFIVADYSNSRPSVAFNGSNYFVVWRQIVEPWFWIHGALISPSGTVLGYTYNIAEFDAWARGPSVVSDGSNFLVVWYQGGDIYGARIAPSGAIIDSVRIVISSATEGQSYPTVDFDGTNYLVVWQDERSGNDIYDIYGARVTPSGVVLDTSGFAISITSEDQMCPSVVFDGTNHLVVWHDSRDSTWDIYGARVTRSGTVIDTGGIAISTAVSNQSHPKAAFDRSNYFVTWYDARDYNTTNFDIYGTRVTPSGVVIDTGGIAISTFPAHQQVPAVAFADTSYLVVWEDWRDFGVSHYNIYGARIDTSGVIIDTSGFVISTIKNEQRSPSVAFDGTNYLAVWEEYRGGWWDIYGARVSQVGNTLDTTTIAISTGSLSEQSPAVSFSAVNYLIVWEDWRYYYSPVIYGARVNQAGVVLDPSGINISGGGRDKNSPSIVSDGTNYFVVWQDERNWVQTRWDIYGARVAPSGTVLDSSSIAISVETGYQLEPSLIFNDVNYFVVWSDKRTGLWLIYGSRVSPTGTVIDTAGICISIFPTPSARRPSIAYDGINHLVVWQGFTNNNNYDIYGARVTQSGVVLDTSGFVVSASVYQQEYPCVVFDGSNYVVVWEEIHTDSKNIYGAKVNTSGVVIDSFIVSQQSGDQTIPALTHGLGDQLLITYSGWTDSIGSHSAEIMRIWGKLYPFVGIKEDITLKNQVTKFNLQVYPNPIHKKCNIKYILSQKTSINISVFDITGRFVKDVINETQEVGIYCKTFDVDDLPQGVYFIRLKAENYSDTKKAIFIK